MKKTLMVALGVISVAHAAQAVEINGGKLELGYSAFTDETDLNRFATTGSIEIGFSRSFAVQADLGFYNFDAIGDTGRNATLHAIFHGAESYSLGAFIGDDDVLGADVTFYGVEGGFELGQVDAEAYLATGDDSGVDGSLFGLKLVHVMPNNIGLNAKIDHARFDGGVDATRLSIGVDYAVNPGTRFYGEIGSFDADAGIADISEPFVGVGVKFDFGAARGTTFGRRGLLDLLPGL